MSYTYVASDVHGNGDAYYDLKAILNSDDRLYIIGDVLDRDDDGIEILQDIMSDSRITLIMGNHESLLNMGAFRELHAAGSPDEVEEIISANLAIEQIGQEQTLRDFAELSKGEQGEIIEFLNNLPLYEELTVNGKNYILVHGGLPDFSGLPVDYYEESELLFGPHNFDEQHYEDTTVIVGHLPTRFIHGAEPDCIFRCGDSIAIDCGCGMQGGRLGVICLDTDEEFYF
ncbi:MAG: metallophosphoesterase [Clostridia bacterium]|nr:metallophosphoesterase [Clostridia bacterium]